MHYIFTLADITTLAIIFFVRIFASQNIFRSLDTALYYFFQKFELLRF